MNVDGKGGRIMEPGRRGWGGGVRKEPAVISEVDKMVKGTGSIFGN